MLNLSDKELDRLSREAADQYEPDEEISSWEKLEQQLSREIEDEPPATPTRFRARPLGYGALLLLLVGTSYFLLKTGNDSKSSTLKNKVSIETSKQGGEKSNSPAQNSNVENQPANTDNKAVDKNAPAVTDNTSNSATDAASPSAKTESALGKTQGNAVAKKNGISGANDKTNNKSVNSGLKDSKKSDNNQNNIVAKNKTTTGAGKINNGANVPGNALAIGGVGAANKNNHNKSGNGKKGSENIKQGNVSDVENVNSSALLQNESSSTSGQNKIAGVDETDKPKYATLPELAFSDISANGISDSSLVKVVANTDNNPSPKKNQSLHINRSLKIGLMVAPDVTLVHSTSSDRFSTNIGLTLGYQFLGRWSINSGIIYTKKNYAAKGEDFHPKMPNYNPDNFELVTGNCDMWEIPLSLRYDFPSTNKINFFVNAGLSSYLMKSEAYDLYYRGGGPWGSPGGVWQLPKVNSNEKYWFSIATISAGIEHQFSKNFSLQAEPFVKIPFKGVGWGNLQLNSYGVSFSLRYSPVLSKSRH